MKQNGKKIKPSKIDISFTYICHECGEDHWVTLKENQTENFMVVCKSCDAVIYTTPLAKVSVKYKEDKPKPQKVQETDNNDLVDRCVKSLVYYGFDKSEAISMAEEACHKYDTSDVGELVKKMIFDFGGLNATTEV